jgi:hypothetical protein
MAAPLDHEIIIFGRAEAAAEAIVEGVQIAAEVAAGTVDRFSDETPEVLQALDLAAIDDIDHRHSPHDKSVKRVTFFEFLNAPRTPCRPCVPISRIGVDIPGNVVAGE